MRSYWQHCQHIWTCPNPASSNAWSKTKAQSFSMDFENLETPEPPTKRQRQDMCSLQSACRASGCQSLAALRVICHVGAHSRSTEAEGEQGPHPLLCEGLIAHPAANPFLTDLNTRKAQPCSRAAQAKSGKIVDREFHQAWVWVPLVPEVSDRQNLKLHHSSQCEMHCVESSGSTRSAEQQARFGRGPDDELGFERRPRGVA